MIHENSLLAAYFKDPDKKPTSEIPCKFIEKAFCNRKYGDCENCIRPGSIGWQCEGSGKWKRLWMPHPEGCDRVKMLQIKIGRIKEEIAKIRDLMHWAPVVTVHHCRPPKPVAVEPFDFLEAGKNIQESTEILNNLKEENPNAPTK